MKTYQEEMNARIEDTRWLIRWCFRFACLSIFMVTVIVGLFVHNPAYQQVVQMAFIFGVVGCMLPLGFSAIFITQIQQIRERVKSRIKNTNPNFNFILSKIELENILFCIRHTLYTKSNLSDSGKTTAIEMIDRYENRIKSGW